MLWVIQLQKFVNLSLKNLTFSGGVYLDGLVDGLRGVLSFDQFNNLKTKDFYCDLTLSELRTIYTFADIFSGNVTQSDILYGDNIFNTK